MNWWKFSQHTRDSPHLDFEITPQPTEKSCGPACLHALYRYYNDNISLEQVVDEVKKLPEGGTLTVYLGLHAQKRGYDASIYTVDLQVFDPTWFKKDKIDISKRLLEQMKIKKDENILVSSKAYIEFLRRGGSIFMEEITPQLIYKVLRNKTPIITGLSATWLYGCSRERQDNMESDDIVGSPTGHFVVLRGIDSVNCDDLSDGKVAVSDPYLRIPRPGKREYHVDVPHLISSILLGIVTYDAKLLVIKPKNK